MRLSFIHNPKDAHHVEKEPSRRRISSIVSRLASAKFLTKVSPSDLLSAFSGDGNRKFADTKYDGHVDPDEEYNRFVRACRLFVRELQIPPGKQAIMINGRVSDSFLVDVPWLYINHTPPFN
jgi:UDP-glucose:glycoprotein glucosyltransferase